MWQKRSRVRVFMGCLLKSFSLTGVPWGSADASWPPSEPFAAAAATLCRSRTSIQRTGASLSHLYTSYEPLLSISATALLYRPCTSEKAPIWATSRGLRWTLTKITSVIEVCGQRLRETGSKI